ncbi:hypothetical protein LTR09_004934 [Extremus antarcticus]|uniref:Uncharacterized protein n=1 Tax=Extremus antarcticus TaxID=702011 RepID=A0AAJ0DHQ6_9PEZI|nr:hypothetical protein LTR09_004934 [Extremus antarcticus]
MAGKRYTATRRARRLPARVSPFRFVELPPELRDWVYEHCAAHIDFVEVLPRGKGWKVTSLHPLHKVSHQVDVEFTKRLASVSLYNTDIAIIARTIDLNFDPIRFFLNRMDDTKFAQTQFGNGPGAKMLLLDITISEEWLDTADTRSVGRWNKFLHQMVNKGAPIRPADIIYTVNTIEHPSRAEELLDVSRPSEVAMDWFEPARRALHRYFAYGTSSEHDAAVVRQQLEQDVLRKREEYREENKAAYAKGYKHAKAGQLAHELAGIGVVPDVRDSKLARWVRSQAK